MISNHEFTGGGFDSFALTSETQADGARLLADRQAIEEAARLLHQRQYRLDLDMKVLPEVGYMTLAEILDEIIERQGPDQDTEALNSWRACADRLTQLRNLDTNHAS